MGAVALTAAAPTDTGAFARICGSGMADDGVVGWDGAGVGKLLRRVVIEGGRKREDATAEVGVCAAADVEAITEAVEEEGERSERWSSSSSSSKSGTGWELGGRGRGGVVVIVSSSWRGDV